MGLGDVHLMLGVGAVIGAGPVVVAFFLAPFFGILLAIYKLVIRSKQELPYGPYLSLGTAAVMLFYCPIAEYFRPGLQALMYFLTGAENGG
jgi:prepilin signal peptidase PulO-like enzyme (type II secretory pathway)